MGIGISSFKNVKFRMKSDTEFVREEAGKKVYGVNQLQPSVGDSGAPVFTFKGKVP